MTRSTVTSGPMLDGTSKLTELDRQYLQDSKEATDNEGNTVMKIPTSALEFTIKRQGSTGSNSDCGTLCISTPILPGYRMKLTHLISQAIQKGQIRIDLGGEPGDLPSMLQWPTLAEQSGGPD